MKSKLIIILFALSSCTAVAKIIYGAKNPKPRSSDYIQKYANRYQLNHFKQYSISETGFINFFEISKELSIRNSINHVIIFNREGQLIQPYDTISCSSDINNFIQSYNDSDKNRINDTINFSDVFGDSITNLENKNLYYSPQDNKPLIVLTWASFVGRLNKINTKVWADSVQKIVKSGDVNAIFLNFDIRENWDLNKK